MALPDILRERCPRLRVTTNVPLSGYTTLRVGGPTDYFAEPASREEILSAVQAARETGTPLLLIGGGSNLLVRDGGFRGLTLHLGKNYAAIDASGERITALAGAALPALSREAMASGLTGLEFAGGIPGSVGGAVYMNAGAYGGEMSQIVETVDVYENDRLIALTNADMDFSYRHSRLADTGGVVLSATVRLRAGDRDAIERAMRDLAARRREKQPLEYPSAGSFFKRPEGHFAGALIEQANLKGVRVGGAQVSEKHAGFLINRGGATADDFLRLMRLIQETVYARAGVALENEARIVGEDM